MKYPIWTGPNSPLAELDLTGPVGTRCMHKQGSRWHSPIYSFNEWNCGINTARCPMGCKDVPNEQHVGCGFHAHWRIEDTVRLEWEIAIPSAAFLVECFGRVILHERGLRAEKVQVVAAIQTSPYMENGIPSRLKEAVAAAYDFRVPIISQEMAQRIIDTQRELYLPTAPMNIHYGLGFSIGF